MNNQTIEKFVQEYQQFVQEFSKKAQENLKIFLNQFFEENPGVNVITWTQYAPYFNDGEPCEFCVHDPTFSNAVDPDDIKQLYDGFYDGEDESIWAVASYSSKNEKINDVNMQSVSTLSKFITSEAMEDVLRTVFGEDNRIIITRDGIVSEDYSGDHD